MKSQVRKRAGERGSCYTKCMSNSELRVKRRVHIRGCGWYTWWQGAIPDTGGSLRASSKIHGSRPQSRGASNIQPTPSSPLPNSLSCYPFGLSFAPSPTRSLSRLLRLWASTLEREDCHSIFHDGHQGGVDGNECVSRRTYRAHWPERL